MYWIEKRKWCDDEIFFTALTCDKAVKAQGDCFTPKDTNLNTIGTNEKITIDSVVNPDIFGTKSTSPLKFDPLAKKPVKKTPAWLVRPAKRPRTSVKKMRSRSKPKSDVWKFYIVTSDKNALCKFCKEVSFKNNSTRI